MHDNYNSLLEYKAVLNKAKKSINKDSVSNVNLDEENDAAGAPLIHGDDVRVAYMAGTIFKAEQLRFKKMIFRATRGNALCDFEDLKMELKDYSGKNQDKAVYIIVFQEGTQTRKTITKICDSFMGERFEIPHGNVNDKIMDITQKITETQDIMKMTKMELQKYLISINNIQGNVSLASY